MQFFFYHFNFVFVWPKSEKRGCFIVKHFKLVILMSKIQNFSNKTLAADLVDMFVCACHLHKPQTIPRPFTGQIFTFFFLQAHAKKSEQQANVQHIVEKETAGLQVCCTD